MNTNQNETRSLLQKSNEHHDHLELKLNALFALGATLGVVWLYYKWKKSEEQPMLLDCNSLDKPENTPKEEKMPPMYPNPLYPILSEEIKSNRNDIMEQLVAIENEKTKSLKECQDFLRQSRDMDLARRTIVAYVDSHKTKQGSYTPYGL
jgi:bacterioferritin (cytochrome b1)